MSAAGFHNLCIKNNEALKRNTTPYAKWGKRFGETERSNKYVLEVDPLQYKKARKTAQYKKGMYQMCLFLGAFAGIAMLCFLLLA